MKRYDNLDGLRAYSAVGILLMHVLAVGQYRIEGELFEWWIPRLADLVFLFMITSAFSMCCGYLEQLTHNELDLSKFYSRRLSKIWPFFALLSLFELILSPTKETFYEFFINLTLCFGFLPNNTVSVIGVGWTLGVIVVFYLLFPFFCYLLSEKKRAWFIFIVSIIMNQICKYYFFDSNHVLKNFNVRSNILYCAMFFVAGGLIFLYRKKLKQFVESYRILMIGAISVLTLVCYWCDAQEWSLLLLFSAILIYSLGTFKITVLNNRMTRFLSGISMEIYLCHFAVLKILLRLNDVRQIVRNEVLSYMVISLFTLVGAIVVSVFIRRVIKFVSDMILSRKEFAK